MGKYTKENYQANRERYLDYATGVDD